MLLPVRLKHDDPPLRLNGERISQGAVQRALPPVGEHPVLKGIFKSVRGDGLGVEREEMCIRDRIRWDCFEVNSYASLSSSKSSIFWSSSIIRTSSVFAIRLIRSIFNSAVFILLFIQLLFFSCSIISIHSNELESKATKKPRLCQTLFCTLSWNPRTSWVIVPNREQVSEFSWVFSCMFLWYFLLLFLGSSYLPMKLWRWPYLSNTENAYLCSGEHHILLYLTTWSCF